MCNSLDHHRDQWALRMANCCLSFPYHPSWVAPWPMSCKWSRGGWWGGHRLVIWWGWYRGRIWWVVVTYISNNPSSFFVFKLAFITCTMSSGGPPQSMYDMRSPDDNVTIAAETVSSHAHRVNGDISPTRAPSSSTTPTDVCSINDCSMALAQSLLGHGSPP